MPDTLPPPAAERAGASASIWLQYALPKQALTELAGALARRPLGAPTQWAIRAFARRYQVDMSEALVEDFGQYASFNDFFTRALKPGARPLVPDGLLCPVDGAVSQCGRIEGDRIFQAKGQHYRSIALLGGDAQLAAQFDGGHFATLYLSPRDYHRIHMPCAGRLKRMIHVPGSLFSVNPATARAVPGLFARNERVVCIFETEHGGQRFDFALVLVGATIVGSMATVWHGVVNPPRPGVLQDWNYRERQIALERGAEMGRFLLGSTVVLLFPPGRMQFEPDWVPERSVRMGERMGQWLGQSVGQQQ